MLFRKDNFILRTSPWKMSAQEFYYTFECVHICVNSNKLPTQCKQEKGTETWHMKVSALKGRNTELFLPVINLLKTCFRICEHM